MNKLLKCIILVGCSFVAVQAHAGLLRQTPTYNYGASGNPTISNWEPWTVTQPSSGDGVAFLVLLQQSVASTSVSLATSDNQTGNTYTVAEESPPGASGEADTQIALVICTGLKAVAGTYQVTFTATNGNIWSVAALDFNVAIAVDQYDFPGGMTNSGTSIPLTAGGANSKADEIVLTGLLARYNASALGLSNPTSGYTSIMLEDPGNTNSMEMAYKETSAIETSSADYSWTTSALAAAAVATIKAATSGPPKSQFFFGNVRRSKGAYLEGGLQADLASLLPSLSGAFVPGRALVRELFQDEQYATKRMAIN